MGFAKDWRRYNPNMELMVRGFKKGKHCPMEANYEEAGQGQALRQQFYAYARALGRAASKDKVAAELWETARLMSFRLATMDGQPVNFVKGYTGPVKLTICTADYMRHDDPLAELLKQNGLLATDEELADFTRPSFQAILDAQAEVDKKNMLAAEAKPERSETVNLAPTQPVVDEPGIPPFAQMSLKRQPSWAKFAIDEEAPAKEVEADSPPAPEWKPDPTVEYWKDTHFTKEEIVNAGAQVFWARILDSIWAKSPESAIAIAQKQLVAYAADGSSTHSKEANIKILAETRDWLAGKNLTE